jgi:hypothetical protein
MNVRDMGMIERGQRLRFALEAGEAIAIIREGVRQDLQRDVTMQLRVTGAIDLAHPTRTDRREDFVDAKSGADGQGHR